MAFKQGNNPLSRKTSPMRTSPFRKEASVSMEDLKKMSAKQDAESKAQALKLPQIEKPGFDYEMDQDMSYPGGERGRDYDEEGTKDGMSRKESPFNMEGSKADHEKKMGKKIDDHDWGGHTQTEKHHRKPEGMSRKEAAYFGLGEDDGKARKTKKADKTAKQIIKMQNKRSSVKNVYLGDPDDLEGEMVRTADKPAGKREKRKVKKLKKTKDQLGDKTPGPLSFLGPQARKLAKENASKSGKKNAEASRIPRKSIGSVTTLKSEKKVDVKTDKKDIDSKLLTKTTPKNKTAKDAGKVDKSGRDGSNRQERKKRRAERKSIRKDKTLSSSQKTMAKKESREKQKENVRGVKK